MGASLELTEAAPLPERIGQYTILCQLDQGGMATLFLGRAAGLGGFERLFAIKLIHEHLSREKRFVDMFLDEARLAARIVHPNVVSVYEVGLDRGRHFIAMDYINGETLSLALQHTWGQKQPFPLGLAVYLAGQAAEGLHAAHELKGVDGQPLGVVHRDVAPSNLMLGYDGILRVMDFGVAKARDQVTHTRPGTIKGTLAYMAPEHVRSRVLDRRADVWSLGVVLWETLVGKRLFKGRNDVETSERLLRRKVLPPSDLRPEVPAVLDGIVRRALDRDPDRRYPTAREFGEALQEYLATARVRIGPSDVEAFMQTTFEERFSWRQEIQQRAPTATAKEFRAYEGLIENPTSDSEVEIDLLAEEAMEEIFEEPEEPKETPHAPDESVASDDAQLVAPPVIGLTEEEKRQQLRSPEPTQVIRSERALARARHERVEKVSDGRIFLYQWREKADQSVELMLQQTRPPRALLYAIAAAAVLVLALVVWRSSGPEEPQFETLSPTPAQPEVSERAPPREVEGETVTSPPEPTETEAALGPSPIEPAPPPTKQPDATPSFELRFQLSPSDAQLSVDGRALDSRERITVEGERSVLVEATAPGYRPYRKSTRVSEDLVLRIELSRLADEASQSRTAKKPRQGTKKTSKLLIVEGGDL